MNRQEREERARLQRELAYAERAAALRRVDSERVLALEGALLTRVERDLARLHSLHEQAVEQREAERAASAERQQLTERLMRLHSARPAENGRFLETLFEEAWLDVHPEIALLAEYRVLDRYRLDFAHPATYTAIELDGASAHSGAGAIARDRQRQRAIERAGWHFERFGGSEVLGDPYGCVEHLFSIITGRQK